MGGLGIVVGLLVASSWPVIHDKAITDFDMAAVIGAVPKFCAILLLMLAYAIIGGIDDWLTIKPRNGKRGIGSKPKFLLQLIIAIGFVAWLALTKQVGTEVNFLPFQYLGRSLWNVNLGWIYWPIAVLLITGMANFVNITDGLDGLASGLTVILAFALAMFAGPFSMLLTALAGACLAFLWFNYNPAKIFMGDTGSLAIGAMIPAVAIVAKAEIFMIIAAMVFILDGLSSALQWAVFKYTRIRTGTGKRIFKMSPVHHHFELSGIPEQLVVVRFWIAGVLFALLAILIMLWGLR